MNHTQLRPIVLPVGLPDKKVHAALQNLNKQIETFLHERRNLDDSLRRLLEADPGESLPQETPDLEALGGDPWFELQATGKSTRYIHLQREAQLRRKIGDFIDTILGPALSAAIDQARKTIDEAEAASQAKLVSIGYHPYQAHTPDPNMFMPGWAKAHPDVTDARAAYNLAKAAAAHLSTLAADNNAAAKTVQADIHRLQQDAIA